MSKVNDMFRQLELATLEDMRIRRDLLGKAIASLEYAIANPIKHIDIDFTFIYPEPHCYHCVSSGLGFCKKRHKYGTVCEDYKHWREDA